MQPSQIRVIAVVGAGQMGSGIAQVCAAHGYAVKLSDVEAERAVSAKTKMGALLTRLVEKGKLTADERLATLERIEPGGPDSGVAEADLVIEAAAENTDLKQALFRRLDALAPPGAILASNTSSISITRLAAATSRPTQVIGMHFMNPVPLMKLVEVIRAVQTSEQTCNAIVELCEALGKTVIRSADRPGFVVNRMLVPFLNEACFALQEQLSSVEDIDAGARLGLNHPMGPLELADLVGLDTVLAIAEVLHRELGEDKYRPAPLLRNLVAAGWLGRKAGRGFYVYGQDGTKLAAVHR